MIHRIQDMGREDVVKVLQAGCSIYRIITLEESMSLPVLESDDSLQIQQQQQQQQQQNGTEVEVKTTPPPPPVLTVVASEAEE